MNRMVAFGRSLVWLTPKRSTFRLTVAIGGKNQAASTFGYAIAQWTVSACTCWPTKTKAYQPDNNH